MPNCTVVLIVWEPSDARCVPGSVVVDVPWFAELLAGRRMVMATSEPAGRSPNNGRSWSEVVTV